MKLMLIAYVGVLVCMPLNIQTFKVIALCMIVQGIVAVNNKRKLTDL